MQDTYGRPVSNVRGSFRSAVRGGGRSNRAGRVPLVGLVSASADSALGQYAIGGEVVSSEQANAEYRAAAQRMNAKRRSHPPSSMFASPFVSDDFDQGSQLDANYPQPGSTHFYGQSTVNPSSSSSAGVGPAGAGAGAEAASQRSRPITAGSQAPGRRVGTARARTAPTSSSRPNGGGASMRAPTDLPPVIRPANSLGNLSPELAQYAIYRQQQMQLQGQNPGQISSRDPSARTVSDRDPSGRTISDRDTL